MIRRALRALLRLARFLGWCVLCAGALALALEHSGLARRLLESLAGARLASLGGELSVGQLELRWLRPALVIGDLRLVEGAAPGGRTWVALGHVRLDLDLGLAGARLERAEVRGGEAFLTPRLYHGLRALLEESGAGGEGPARSPRPFELRVQDLSISLETLGEELLLGRLDAELGRDARGALALEGSLRQPDRPSGAEGGAVYLSGTERSPGIFELRASAPDLFLGPELLPAAGTLEALRALEPQGRLRLAAHGSVDLERGQARGELRLALGEASLVAPTSPDPFGDLALELGAHYEPEPGQDPWEPRAWRGSARASGRWRGQEVSAGGLLGRAARPGAIFEAWARAPSVAFDEALIELSGRRRELLEIATALRPEGAAADVRVGLRLRSDLAEDAPLARGIELVLDAQVAPGTRITYRGWPSRRGKPEPAFPLLGEVQRGRVVYAHSGRQVRPDRLVVEGTAQHGTGSARIVYQGWSPARDMPPFAPGYGRPESDLLLGTARIAVDDALRRAVEGLGEDPALAGVWERYQPAGGHAAVRFRLSQRADLTAPALDLAVDVEQVDACFDELPVPVQGLVGQVRVRADGRGNLAVGYALVGRGQDAARVEIAGRSRRHQARGAAERRLLDLVDLRVRGLDSAGREAEILAGLLPAVAAALDELRPRGLLGLDLLRWRASEGEAERTTLELSAQSLDLEPPAAPRSVLGVSGRALIEVAAAEGQTTARVRLPGLAGRLSGGARVAWRGSPAPDAPGRGLLTLTGLTVGEAIALGGIAAPGADEGAALEFEGWVDLASALDLQAAQPGAQTTIEGATRTAGLRAHLRGARLGRAGEIGLEDLRGELVLEGELLRAERLLGRLAHTELEFRDALLRPGATPGAGPQLEANVIARGLVLDEAHLSLFLDPATVRSILADLEGRGQIDVEAGRLRVWDLLAERPGAAFEGTLLLSDVSATLGLPLSIRSARARIEQLVLEEGDVRAFARLSDLYGRAAGLELGPATLIVSLVGTRLLVEDFTGTFERGWLRTLARESAARPGPALALDLAPPFPFQMALEFTGVDVARVLRGVFPSSMADRGDLDARLRLAGSLEHLLEIRGSGSVELRRTRLWSVPVFRELFSRLGFDRTLLFDQLTGVFRVADGRIELTALEAKSPIVKLVGAGEVDLDGQLRSDLEVRYSLVDKIPTLRRLIYLLQNTFLTVAVRGDLERPEVILRGEFERIFNPVRARERRLPMPSFSSLPERF